MPNYMWMQPRRFFIKRVSYLYSNILDWNKFIKKSKVYDLEAFRGWEEFVSLKISQVYVDESKVWNGTFNFIITLTHMGKEGL